MKEPQGVRGNLVLLEFAGPEYKHNLPGLLEDVAAFVRREDPLVWDVLIATHDADCWQAWLYVTND